MIEPGELAVKVVFGELFGENVPAGLRITVHKREEPPPVGVWFPDMATVALLVQTERSEPAVTIGGFLKNMVIVSSTATQLASGVTLIINFTEPLFLSLVEGR